VGEGSEELQPSGAQVAELVALADDTLPRGRRAGALQKIGRSPELSAQLEQQRRVVAAIRAWDVQAPASLRARIEHDAQVVRPPVRRRRARAAVAITVGLAVAALLALLVVPSSPSAPTVVEAAELTRQGSSRPAPVPLPGRPALLSHSVAGVAFPNYAAEPGWHAYGRRSDRLGDRLLGTVFYRRSGRRIAYTIVSGPPLQSPSRARPATTLEGVRLGYLRKGRTTIVNWLRGGHTCVLSGAGIPTRVLLNLAVWPAHATQPF
jgi:hypothetical protein